VFGATYSAGAAGAAHAAAANSEAPRPTDETGRPADWLRRLRSFRLLAASFRPSLVYILATAVVVVLVIGCGRWVDRRWDDWVAGGIGPAG
jgi:hypothetical protein